MSTAEQPDALARRIEQLAAASDDSGDVDLGEVAAGLRDQVAGLGAEVGALRQELADRDARAAQSSSAALEDTRGSLEARLAVLEDALDALAERLEALARDGASTTTSLLQTLGETVRTVDRRLAGEADAAGQLADRTRALDDARATGLEDAVVRRLSTVLAARDDELRRTVLDAVEAGRQRAEQDRASIEELTRSVRATLDGFGRELAAASPAAPVELGLREVRSSVTAALDDLRRDLATARPAEGSSGPGLQELRSDVLDALADVREQVRSSGVERSEALTAAVGASGERLSAVTRDLREQVLDAMAELSSGVSRSTAAGEATGARLERLVTASEDVGRAVAELRDGFPATTAELAAELRSYAREQAEATTGRLLGLDEQVRAELAELRAGVDERAEQLLGALARGLTEIADEIDVAATTTRDASQRVTVLAELTEVQQAQVTRLLQGVRDDVVDTGRALRDELLARTSEQLSTLGPRLDQLDATVAASGAGVGVRLGAVDARVARAAGAVERVLAGLEEVAGATDRLGGTVEGFRVEWPTRTHEVVQGARAVAEAVVLDVRGEVGARLQDVRDEVGARLQDVRATLDRVVASVDHARSGLDDGTDRLASAGHVLVAYLEQRDRLLEAERDRVLHEVLDAFAAGLSARERGVLAGRLNDVVVRRRDARDAQRYREAVGEPVAPTAELPEEVLRLAASGPAAPDGGQPAGGGEALPDAPVHAGEPSATHDAVPLPSGPAAGEGAAGEEAAGQDAAGEDPAGEDPAGEDPAGQAEAVSAAPDEAAPGKAAAREAVQGDGARPSAPRPGVARSGRGGAVVVPGPGRAAGTVAPRRGGPTGADTRPALAAAVPAGRGAVVRPAPGARTGSAASGGGAVAERGTDRGGSRRTVVPQEGAGGERHGHQLPARPVAPRSSVERQPAERQPAERQPAERQPAERQPAERQPGARSSGGRPSAGRGRLEAMPQAPRVDVALDAAAPEEDRPAAPPA